MAEKKKEYAEYKEARASMQDLLIAGQNIETMLGSEGKNNEERRRQNQQQKYTLTWAVITIARFFYFGKYSQQVTWASCGYRRCGYRLYTLECSSDGGK